MRLIPKSEWNGPKPITPMIKIFAGLVIANLILISVLICWAFYAARPFPSERTPYQWITREGGYIFFPVPIHLIVLLWMIFNSILVGTFLLLTRHADAAPNSDIDE